MISISLCLDLSFLLLFIIIITIIIIIIFIFISIFIIVIILIITNDYCYYRSCYFYHSYSKPDPKVAVLGASTTSPRFRWQREQSHTTSRGLQGPLQRLETEGEGLGLRT